MLALLLLVLPLHADVIDDLLAIPLLPRLEVADPLKVNGNPPAASAPLAKHVHYWMWATPDMQPSDAVRERLLEAISKEPDAVSRLVQFFPARENVCTRLEPLAKQENVAEWMLHHCASRRERLVEAAGRAADKESWADGADELKALARADWRRAEPILTRLAASDQLRTGALALTLLYEHAPNAARRSALQATAEDASAPGYARDLAFEALASWNGFDEWLLARMHDATLLDLRDGFSGYAPISRAVERDPPKWIPVMIRLLGHEDRTVRTLAVHALAQFHLEEARADALAPLLPWLSQPDWAEDRWRVRLRIVQSVARLGMRDAIPHLVHVLANDTDDSIRKYAAEALVEMRGVTTEELARGLAAWAAQQPRTDPDVLIGEQVAKLLYTDEPVSKLIVKRIAELEATQPKLAAALLEIVQWWTTPSAQILRLQRIENGTAGATLLVAALTRGHREHDAATLRRLEAAGGIRAGIGAALAHDPKRVLAGTDRDAQRALLVASRIVREPLPLDAVQALFGHTSALDAAAEAFLLVEDSARARALVQQRHPGELLILGWRSNIDHGHETYGWFDEWEAELLHRFHAGKADEVIALGRASTWSAGTTVAEITIRGGKATLRSGRGIVPLSGAALAELRRFLADTRFDDLPLFDMNWHDAPQYEYVHLTRGSGRRVFMNNPAFDAEQPYGELVRRIEALLR